MDDEHEYLRWMVADRLTCALLDIGHEFRDLCKEAAAAGDKLEVECLRTKKQYLFQLAYLEKVRADEILDWMYKDSLLRQQGSTYSDVQENYFLLAG